MKIVYCLNSIHYLGGIQRVTLVKANALADVPDNEVFLVVTDSKKGVLVEDLSPRVKVIDLDVNYYADDWKSKFHVLKGILVKRLQHKKKLAKTLQEIQPDIVISVGQSEKYFLPSIKGKWKTIREFHFVRDYRMRQAHSKFSKCLAFLGDFYDFNFKAKRYDKIVTLTREDLETNWKGWRNVTAIPNPVSFKSESVSPLTQKTVVTTGRLNLEKNYASLIRAFKIVAQQHPDWQLKIYGEGPEHANLQHDIDEAQLSGNVTLQGFSSDVREAMLQASLFVLTSLHEGFGLVMIEAMECGLPVVSYQCPCGPKEIISEGKDGFLVPLNDEKALAQRICQLIENQELRLQMGKAAKQKAQTYQVENIIEQWMTLFRTLAEQK